jgi:hypothetical protein
MPLNPRANLKTRSTRKVWKNEPTAVSLTPHAVMLTHVTMKSKRFHFSIM